MLGDSDLESVLRDCVRIALPQLCFRDRHVTDATQPVVLNASTFGSSSHSRPSSVLARRLSVCDPPLLEEVRHAL